MGGVIELPGIGDAGRIVRKMPLDAQAASVLRGWLAQDDSTLDASRLDLYQADLSGADLAMGILTDAVLRGVRLVGTDLYRAHLEGAVFDEADLSGASLVKAVLDEASLRRATLNDADLGSAELSKVDARSAYFRAAKLDGASLIDVKLQGADLTNASVRETSLKAVLDDQTVVRGLSGTIFGPALVHQGGTQREVAGSELESWLNSRGAEVQVLGADSRSITYYAKMGEGYSRSSPRGIIRRRVVGGVVYDEAFTRNLCWESTGYLRFYDLGHNEVDHVKITVVEAAAFIAEVTRENS